VEGRGRRKKKGRGVSGGRRSEKQEAKWRDTQEDNFSFQGGGIRVGNPCFKKNPNSKKKEREFYRARKRIGERSSLKKHVKHSFQKKTETRRVSV